MRVQKVRHNTGYEFTLLDDEGLAIPVVSNFLSYLRARGCSPNTLCAYAHDLQHFYRFLKSASIQVQEFTPRRTLDFLKYLREVPSRGKARTPPAIRTDCGAAPQSIPGGRLRALRRLGTARRYCRKSKVRCGVNS